MHICVTFHSASNGGHHLLRSDEGGSKILLNEVLVESCPTSVRDKVCYVLIWSWEAPHIANWFYGGTPISSWYQSGLSSCEAKRPHALDVTQLLSTCRLENRPHVRGRVESCLTSVRDKVCYVLIWSWATPHIANWFYGGTPISSVLQFTPLIREKQRGKKREKERERERERERDWSGVELQRE